MSNSFIFQELPAVFHPTHRLGHCQDFLDFSRNPTALYGAKDNRQIIRVILDDNLLTLIASENKTGTAAIIETSYQMSVKWFVFVECFLTAHTTLLVVFILVMIESLFRLDQTLLSHRRPSAVRSFSRNTP